MTFPCFFGYGSLVNRRTHGYTGARRAVARGWRRAWRYTADREVAFLTVIPDPACTIDGLVASVPVDAWPTLDLREHAYERLDARDSVTGAGDGHPAIYAIASDRLNTPDDHHPVLLSYLDVVVQGYLTEYGRDGAARFFATTTGWEAPILDDRAAPRYPRAQDLSEGERAFVDRHLQTLNCRIIA